MNWLLVVLLAFVQPHPTTLQIPVKTKELCEKAAEQVKKNFSVHAFAAALAKGAPLPRKYSGVITSCVEISN